MKIPPLNLCIIENGLVPEELIDVFGSYPNMIENWLKPVMPNDVFTTVSAITGQQLPQPDCFDGYILTGSKHNVCENTDWMVQQIAFLKKARIEAVPVFGICFGHQIMAEAYGGKTTKAPQGWGVGVQSYQGCPKVGLSGNVFVFHQDQVSQTPPQAEVIGGSDHCVNGVLQYSFPALSVQYHPEFSNAYVAALNHKYNGTVIPKHTAESATKSLQELPVNTRPMAETVKEFFYNSTK